MQKTRPAAPQRNRAAKGALWGIVPFYLLIACEMLYMAGPFALYFYGVYHPILSFFNRSPALSVLNRFFLPHIVRSTASPLVNLHEYLGAALALVGLAVFLAGAIHIYSSKLRRKGAVTSGLYRYVRHPQYTAFAICGLGMLILWPRYLNLFLFVTMLFVYFLLARAEERECGRKFGQSYLEYKARTSMFIPGTRAVSQRLAKLPEGKAQRALALVCLYLAALVAAYGGAKAINLHAINSLYAAYTSDSATVALCELSQEQITGLLRIAVQEERVAQRLGQSTGPYLNYVLPVEWFAAEVPMNGVAYGAGHRSPKDYGRLQYKIILTQARLRGNAQAGGKEIFSLLQEREPILEVWVDLGTRSVTKILEIPADYKYQGIPVAVY